MSNSGGSGAERNLIVVVDDDEAVRDSLRFSFVIEGFAVRAFSSGQQLLAETSLPAWRLLRRGSEHAGHERARSHLDAARS